MPGYLGLIPLGQFISLESFIKTLGHTLKKKKIGLSNILH